jgi:hypothetical protein
VASSNSPDWRLIAFSADLGQQLFLGEHGVRVLLGPVDDRHHRIDQATGGKGHRLQSAVGLTTLQTTHADGQHRRGFAHFREGLRLAGQRLQHRLGQPL